MKGKRLAGVAFVLLLLAPVLLVLVGFKVAPLLRALSLAGSVDGARLAALWGGSALLCLIELPLIAVAGLALPPVLRRAGRWRGALVALILAPLLLPDSVLAATAMSILGLSPAASGAPSPAAAAVLVAIDSLDYGGIAAILALLLGRRLGGRPGRPGPEGVALMLVLLARLAGALVGNIDVAATVSSVPMEPAVPAAYPALWPRGGMGPEALGEPASAWLLQLGLQLALVLPLAFCAYRLVGTLPPAGPESDAFPSAPAGPPFALAAVASALWIGTIVAIVVWLVAPPLIGLSRALGELRSRLPEGVFAASFLRFGVCAVAAAILSTFCTVAAAYPLARGGARGRAAYGALLLLLLAMPSSGVPDYVVLRSYGMLNTIYPFLLRGIVPVWAVLILALLRRTAPAASVHPVDRTEPYAFFYGFLAPVRRELAALGLVLLAASWGEVGAAGIFMSSSAAALSPVALFRALAASSGVDGAVRLAGLLVSLPPLLILAALPRLLGLGGSTAPHVSPEAAPPPAFGRPPSPRA